MDAPDTAPRATTDPTGACRQSPPGALLGRGAVVIWNDVLPEGREAFYAWHDREHMPERLAIPGFRRGRRFIAPGHSPEWLTVYEADDVEVLTSRAYLDRLNAPTPATTASLKYFANTSRAICRLALTFGTTTGGHVLALRLALDASAATVLERYIGEDAFPRAMRMTGVLACHLFASDTSASFVRTTESRDRAFDVPSSIILCEASRPDAAEAAGGAIERDALRRLGVRVREDAAVYALEACRLAMPARH